MPSKAQSAKKDILAQLAGCGEEYSLPGGGSLRLTLPTLKDVLAFDEATQSAMKEARPTVMTGMKPHLVMLRGVTAGYKFDDGELWNVMSACGGVDGPLMRRVRGMYGLPETVAQSAKLAESGEGSGEVNPTP